MTSRGPFKCLPIVIYLLQRWRQRSSHWKYLQLLKKLNLPHISQPSSARAFSVTSSQSKSLPPHISPSVGDGTPTHPNRMLVHTLTLPLREEKEDSVSSGGAGQDAGFHIQRWKSRGFRVTAFTGQSSWWGNGLSLSLQAKENSDESRWQFGPHFSQTQLLWKSVEFCPRGTQDKAEQGCQDLSCCGEPRQWLQLIKTAAVGCKFLYQTESRNPAQIVYIAYYHIKWCFHKNVRLFQCQNCSCHKCLNKATAKVSKQRKATAFASTHQRVWIKITFPV